MRYHFIVAIGHGEATRVKNVTIDAADFLDASDQVISAYPRASMILGTKPCRRGGARSLREVFERQQQREATR